MSTSMRPRVYVSYTWRTPGLRERVFELSERLRSAGVDIRLDRYFAEGLHGFAPPTGRAEDPRQAWTIWQEDEIRGADFVLVVCSREYRDAPDYSGAWWDVRFMAQELEAKRAGRSKFIPAGFGPHRSVGQYLPPPTAGEHYYDLDARDGVDALLRRIEGGAQATAGAPDPGEAGKGNAMADGVKLFISHAHRDEDIAEKLVVAVETAMAAPGGAIRCTSVPGYKLDLGAMAPDALRRGLASAEAVVAVLTPHSLASQWVLFELGAVWSQAKRAIPLLGGGLKDDDIPGPFRGAAGGQLTDASALDQFLEQLSGALGWPRKNLVAARGQLGKLAAHVAGKSFFDDEVEREVKATFAAKRARIGATQGSILDYIGDHGSGRPCIPQGELRARFKDVATDLHYRLEHLRHLGFLSRKEIGKKDGKPEFGWTLAPKYKDEIG